MSYESDNESLNDGVIATNTLLGFVDVEISKDEPLYANDSFIGGQPLPMDAGSIIPAEFVHCKNCKKPMRLLSQINAALPDTWYDRALYVFICIESGCRRKEGSVRAIRGIKKDKDIMAQREEEERKKIEEEKERERKRLEKEEEKKNLVNSIFNTQDSSSNPFASASSNPFATSNPFDTKTLETEIKTVEEPKATLADSLKSLTEKKIAKNVNTSNYTLPEFKGYILYFENEVLDPANQVLMPIPDNLKITEADEAIDDNASGNIQAGNLPKVNPDKNKPTEDLTKLFDDQTFQNFSRILSFNTQQVVRYEVDGSPILYSAKDEVSRIFYTEDGKFKDKSQWNIPAPAYHPSGSRHVELQLMPKMIIDLEKDVTDVNMIVKNGMEWGTIIVATDADDFVPPNWLDDNGVVYLEEWCGVQWEDEVKA